MHFQMTPSWLSCIFARKSSEMAWCYGRSHATVWTCSKWSLFSRLQLPQVRKRELNFEVFLVLVRRVCYLWNVYICPSGQSVSDESSVNTALPFYIHSDDWDTVVIEQLPSHLPLSTPACGRLGPDPASPG